MEDGEEVVQYFTSEEEADRAAWHDESSIQRALSAIGAWSHLDLDFDEMLDELDRIRHRSKPTRRSRLTKLPDPADSRAVRQHRPALRRGQLIGDMDTLIAATALEHILTIVTLDPDFQRMPNLNVMLLTRSQLL